LGDGDDALASRNAANAPFCATTGISLLALRLDEEVFKLQLAGMLEFVKTEPEHVLLYVSQIPMHSVKLEAFTDMRFSPLIVALQYIRYTLPSVFSKIEWHSGTPLAIGRAVAMAELANGDVPAAADELVSPVKESGPLYIDRDEVPWIDEVAEGMNNEDDPTLVLELLAPIATLIDDTEAVAATGVTDESEVDMIEDEAEADVLASSYIFKELIDQ